MSNHYLSMTDEELLAEANRLIKNFDESSLTFAQGGLSASSRTAIVSALIRAGRDSGGGGGDGPTDVSDDPVKLQDVIKAPSMSPWNDPSETQALRNYLDKFEDSIRKNALNNHNAIVVDIIRDPNRLRQFRSNPDKYENFPLAMWAKIRERDKPDDTSTVEEEQEEPIALNNVSIREGIVMRNAEPRNTGWKTPGQVNVQGTDWSDPQSVLDTDVLGAARNDVDSSYSAYLLLQDFGFSVPEGSTILGIEIETTRQFFGSGNENLEEEIQLVQCRKDTSLEQDYVYLTSGGVKKYDSGGTLVWQVSGARRVRVDSEGNVYSADGSQGFNIDLTAKKLDVSGNVVWNTTLATNIGPDMIRIDQQGNPVIKSDDNYVRKLDKDDGSLIWEFQAGGTVGGIVLDTNDNVYIGSWWDHATAYKLDADGNQVWTHSVSASMAGGDFDPNAELIYFADADSKNIHVFNSAGHAGTKISGAQGFNGIVRDVAVNSQGYLYTAIENDPRTDVFAAVVDPVGNTVIRTLDNDGTNSWGLGVAADSEDNIIISGVLSSNDLRKYDSDGNLLWQLDFQLDPGELAIGPG